MVTITDAMELVMWGERQQLQKMAQQAIAEDLELLDSPEVLEMMKEEYRAAAREHLLANGGEADDELVEKIATEVAKGIENRSFKWKHEPIVISIDEKVDKYFGMFLHDALEDLGYGPYALASKTDNE